MPHKNFRWIYENAKNSPHHIFVIAGKTFTSFCEEMLDNVMYLGYVTDGENKTLMKNCKAFLYPSKYEGFGLPPLEALSCGADIMLSDIRVFHELYDECATFFEPDDYSFDFRKSSNINKKRISECLEKYTLDHAADQWLMLIQEAE